MNRKKRLKVLLTAVLCAVLTVTSLCCISFDVLADDYLGSGNFGDDLCWTLDYNGRLTVSGNGAIPDFGDYAGGNPAWYNYASEIKQILIDDGITSIGDEAFECCYNTTAVVVGKDVTQIGSNAFSDNRSYGIYFTGSAPIFSSDTFLGYHFVTCIYYPELEGWSNAAGQNYGSYYSIDWHPAYKPQSTTITAAYNKNIGAVEISWEEASYAYEYDVYRKAGDDQEATLLGSYAYVTTHTDYTIEKGVKYTYYVVVRSTEARLSEESNTVSVFLKLDKPEVTASTVAATGRIKLSWNQVEDATGYRVYRSTSKSSGFKAVKLIKSGSTTTFTDSGVTAGTKYFYKVVALHTNSSANSAYSALAGTTADLARPSVTVKNDAKTGKIVLSWKKITGSSGYKIYRSTAEGSGYSAIRVIKSGSTTTYTDTDVKAGTKYYYKVMATHSVTGANSAYSSVDSCMADLPYPVVSVSNDADTGKPVLSWKKISGASGYKIYRATSKTGGYSAIKYIKKGATVTYTDTGAVAGSKYYYKVYAVCEKNTGGNSAYSSVVSSLCDCAKPVIKVASSSLTSVKISWNKVSKANGYMVYRATSKTGTYKKVGTVTTTSYTDKNVNAGSTYYYKVIAKNSNSSANSKYSNIISCKATVKAPTLKNTVQATKNTISISWGKVSGASGYYVYRRSADSSTWKKVATIKSVSTVKYKDSVSAGSYYYCVASYKTSGGKTYVSLKSEEIRTRTLKSSSKISDVGVEKVLQNEVSWSAVSGATGYQLYYKVTKDGDWKYAGATTGKSSCSFIHDVGHGSYYYYKVRAIYEYNGVKTVGPYSGQTKGRMHYYYPNITTWMSSSYKSDCNVMMVYVTNNGVAPIYFYGDGARSVDYDYSGWDRKLVMTNRDFSEIEYTVIQPGESGWVYLITNEDTWYDSETRVVMDVFYDGKWYTTYTSCKYGFNYYKKD